MLHIPEILRHYTECHDFGLGKQKKDTQHFPILSMNEKLSMLYIPEALRYLMLNARTSAWINQKRYTTFPFINHYIYPKST